MPDDSQALAPRDSPHYYGPDWGSCIDCGGDRYLSELDDAGLCEGCAALAKLPKCTECHKVISAEDGELCDPCYRQKASEAGSQLAGRLSIPELVAVYARAERDIRAGFQLVDRAHRALNDAFTLDSNHGISIQNHREQIHFDDPERNLKLVRQSIWRTLVERLELRRFMSIGAWKELEKQLDSTEDVPEITVATVSAMAEQFTSKLPEMLESAIEEVFNYLRPPGSRYKRNSEFEIPKRVALSYVIDQWYAKGEASKLMHVVHSSEQHLAAIENVFTALAGQGQVSKNHYSELSGAIKQTLLGELGETPYFRFRGYRNGSLHLEFVRLDLLKRFNEIAGGNRLRPKKETP